MQSALASEGRLLAEDLYRLIQTLDPAVFRKELEQSVRELADQVATRLRLVRERCAANVDAFGADKLTAIRDALDAIGRQIDELRARASFERRHWRTAFKVLQPRYDALRRGLIALSADQAADLPAVRASNVHRSLFHMGNGFVALATLQFAPYWLVLTIAGVFAVFSWSAETIRRVSPAANVALMRLFAKIAHPHEHYRINSATWYATALIILAVFAPVLASSIAVMVLGLADPAAALIGRRFGRTRLADGRSLEGTLAFALVGIASGLAVLATFYGTLPVSSQLLIAGAAGIAGALAELISGRVVDDNLTIPLVSGFTAWGVLALLA